MELLNREFEKIKESNNPEAINSFLIRLGEKPQEVYLKFLEYFINKLENHIYEKIKLNMVYVLGEIGKLTKIPTEYLQKLIDVYYTSDMWIRHEVIQAIRKISHHSTLSEKSILLLGNALNDDYLPVKKEVLNILRSLETLPESILVNFFYILNSKDTEVLDFCRRILERLHFSSKKIYELLSSSENYKILKPRAIRSLLLMSFKSIINLESLRDLIINAKWDVSYKEQYLKEIDTLQRILLKTL
ncbi:MAG: hypothetical protein ACXAAH_10705 [Promethearchaeota archaeon]|jgi:hypothetical protein